jgi:nucleobase:cation symporter-1, NCS1 family
MGESAAQAAPGAIEKRSIDWVPHEERHGKSWHLGGVWFSGNAELTTTATGVLAITLGGNLVWTLIAMLAGTIFGTFFTAFHSTQGPQLGLPQLIQSRAQFGYLGVALVVCPFMVFNYAGYNIFNGLLAANSMDNVVKLPVNVGLFVVAGVGFAAALWGYDLIHLSQRWLTYAFIIFFGVYTIGVFATIGLPSGSWDLGNFHSTPFFGAFALTVSYQIGWAPYVSDYSRYLPATVSGRETFMWTYWGLVIGGYWMFAMGAIIAAPTFAAGGAVDTVSLIRETGDAVFNGLGAAVLLLSVPALIMIVAMNMYGGALILITMLDSFKPLRPQVWHRAVGIGLIAVTSLILSFPAKSSADFNGYYNNLIVILLYFFTPWTAVNLADYFLVRRGHYAIREIFKPGGMYGQWGWRGIGAYLLGFAAMIPFMVVGAPGTKYEWWIGPVARSLDYTDLSIFVGLPVSAGLYILFSRSLDLKHEQEVIAAEPPMTLAQIDESAWPEHGAPSA